TTDSLIGPNGKSMAALWSKIPKKFANEEIEIMVGEGVGSAASAPDADQTGLTDAVVKVVSFVYEKNTAVQGTFDHMVVEPYTLTMRNVLARLNGNDDMSVQFDYDLVKESEYDGA